MSSAKLMSSQEVCEYLRISLRTLYRLIKKGRPPERPKSLARAGLSAVKQAGVWCFKRREVEAYRDYRMIIYPGLLFHDTVLQEYFAQPQKYRITLKGRTGWLAPRAPQEFKKVKYQKIRWRGTMAAIIVQPRYFARLPPTDQQEWLRFEILR